MEANLRIEIYFAYGPTKIIAKPIGYITDIALENLYSQCIGSIMLGIAYKAV